MPAVLVPRNTPIRARPQRRAASATASAKPSCREADLGQTVVAAIVAAPARAAALRVDARRPRRCRYRDRTVSNRQCASPLRSAISDSSVCCDAAADAARGREFRRAPAASCASAARKRDRLAVAGCRKVSSNRGSTSTITGVHPARARAPHWPSCSSKMSPPRERSAQAPIDIVGVAR